MQTHIIKQESGIRFCKSIFFGRPKGELTLTEKEVSFVRKGKEYFNVALSQITNVRARKGFGAGVEQLIINYRDSNKTKEIKLEYTTLASWAMGQASRLQPLYFSSWEEAIDKARHIK